jgi:hypothetical protein
MDADDRARYWRPYEDLAGTIFFHGLTPAQLAEMDGTLREGVVFANIDKAILHARRRGIGIFEHEIGFIKEALQELVHFQPAIFPTTEEK